jgi:hypothetical protein
MKGFITTAPLSVEAKKLFSDRQARLQIYKNLISQGEMKVDVSSGGTDFSVSTTSALVADAPFLKTESDTI